MPEKTKKYSSLQSDQLSLFRKSESKISTLQGKIIELEKEIMERDFMEGFMENDV